VNLSFSETRPTEMPATGRLIGTPASMSASVPPQTLAILDEPFDSRISETSRTVYGNRVGGGMTALSDRSASIPWPISRRPGPRIGLHSPTEYGGKL
jgi:hypothetical protein